MALPDQSSELRGDYAPNGSKRVLVFWIFLPPLLSFLCLTTYFFAMAMQFLPLDSHV